MDAATPTTETRPRATRHRADHIEAQRPAWARYLTELRESRGLTSTATASRMGVVQSTWSELETGVRVRRGLASPMNPTAATLRRITEALDLTDEESRRLYTLVGQAAVGGDAQSWQARLLAARVAATLTPDQAARLAGVTTRTYLRWEKARRVADPEALRRLLPHFGFSADDVEEFIASVPASRMAPRAPRRAGEVPADLPAWSQLITAKRLEAGLYLADVDKIVGHAGIIRFFEMGGWPNDRGGAKAIPSDIWLDRIADALSMTAVDRARLLDLAAADRRKRAEAKTAAFAAAGRDRSRQWSKTRRAQVRMDYLDGVDVQVIACTHGFPVDEIVRVVRPLCD